MMVVAVGGEKDEAACQVLAVGLPAKRAGGII